MSRCVITAALTAVLLLGLPGGAAPNAQTSPVQEELVPAWVLLITLETQIPEPAIVQGQVRVFGSPDDEVEAACAVLAQQLRSTIGKEIEPGVVLKDVGTACTRMMVAPEEGVEPFSQPEPRQ